MHHFAVTTVDPETGHLAAVGVLLRLEALQDVEAETEGAVKYLAEHTVLRRIEIQRLVNPEADFRPIWVCVCVLFFPFFWPGFKWRWRGKAMVDLGTHILMRNPRRCHHLGI